MFFSLVLVFTITLQVHADRRNYVWTYEYATMLKDRVEIELYFITEVPKKDQLANSTWKQWLELEYGITDKLDLSLYQQFVQKNGVFTYDGFKLRGRARLFSKGELPLDILLYEEYIRSADLTKADISESKIIVAEDINAFNIAYNQILKQELRTKGKGEHEYAL